MNEWIKMRMDLQSHPKVVRILSATGADKFRTIGGLHAVWSVFDLHSEDGKLHGYTPDLMDHVIGWPGFAQAMIAVGWLRFDGAQTLDMPEFSEHNGQSAKRRAEDQKRKRDTRRNVRNVSGGAADKLRTNCGQIADQKEKEKEKKKKDQDQKIEQSRVPQNRGTRLPPDWCLSDAELRWAEDARPDIDPVVEAEKFADYWHAKTGANATKRDWSATWRNWIRNSHRERHVNPSKPSLVEIAERELRRYVAGTGA